MIVGRAHPPTNIPIMVSFFSVSQLLVYKFLHQFLQSTKYSASSNLLSYLRPIYHIARHKYSAVYPLRNSQDRNSSIYKRTAHHKPHHSATLPPTSGNLLAASILSALTTKQSGMAPTFTRSFSTSLQSSPLIAASINPATCLPHRLVFGIP